MNIEELLSQRINMPHNQGVLGSSPSGTTTKIAKELTTSPLAIFLSQNTRIYSDLFQGSGFPIIQSSYIMSC